jgi:hypothetical protein
MNASTWTAWGALASQVVARQMQNFGGGAVAEYRFELPHHARARCFDEQVDPEDVLDALEREHRSKRNATGAFDHFVWIDGTEFRIVATSRTVLTLHRRIRDKNVRRQLRDVSRRTRQMNRIDRRRARR